MWATPSSTNPQMKPPVLCATPLPVRLTTDGELVALLITVALPLALPTAVGAKTTFNVTAWLGINVVPAVTPLALNSAPATVTLEIVTFELPVLVIVTVWEPVLPTAMLPKLMLVGLLLVSRKVGETPAPESATEIDELLALLVIVTEPVTLPTVCGANTTLKVMI